MNQNLFRVFTYATTRSFFNAISAEIGPFTETPISERMLTGAINIRVGTPWRKNALITGWGSTNQRFDSSQLGNSQNFYTSSYIGLSRRFSTRFSAEAIVEDLRAWRIKMRRAVCALPPLRPSNCPNTTRRRRSLCRTASEASTALQLKSQQP
jgi:hypothetical protein